MSDYAERTNDGKVFVGSDQNIFKAALLASSLDMYAASGMLPTRGMTGPKMLKLATQITSKKYQKGQYLEAAVDLREYVTLLKLTPRTEG